MPMEIPTIPERYFRWLCDEIGLPYELNPYKLLFKTMFDKDFVSIIPMDVNREKDGIMLRQNFLDDNPDIGIEIENALNPHCNVFEMLIALAARWDRQYMYNYSDGNRTGKWFFEMINNMLLARYPDYIWTEGSRYQVLMILDDFINHHYDHDGRGGAFPLNRPPRDQRGLQLWDQLADYVNEKYFNI